MKECLIIDDDIDDQEIFVMCVNSISNAVKCTTMNDPVDTINMLTSRIDYLPDYIFIDVNMPKMNGIDCLKQVKKIDRLKDSTIYMYSTSSETATIMESKKMGATDFLVKPSKIAELKTTLSAIFGIVR